MDRKDGSDMAIEQVEQEIDALLLRAMSQGTTLDMFSRVSSEWLRIYRQAEEGKVDG